MPISKTIIKQLFYEKQKPLEPKIVCCNVNGLTMIAFIFLVTHMISILCVYGLLLARRLPV